MSIPSLPELEIDSSGCCWTCVHLGDACDSTLLPTGCRTCAERQRVCEGFHARLSWPRFYDSARKKPDPFAIRLPAHGLPAKEGRLIQHFVHNIARLALSIDYEDNGYRRLVSIALNEASLLYALLAMSASHLSRWHRLPDTTSRIYLRSAFEQLEQRFASPSKMREEATLATMLVLLGYEAFIGGNRWELHYNGISSWLRSCRDCSRIDPFLLSWVCMVDTQSAIHLGTAFAAGDGSCLGSSLFRRNEQAIDPIYGCSVSLPELMLSAAKLYSLSTTHACTFDELHRRSQELQRRVRRTRIDLDSDVFLSMTANSESKLTTFRDGESLRNAKAAAEVFRHTLHIYIARITCKTTIASTETRESVDAIFELLPMVSNPVGPGSMLGWCLVVVGSETDALEWRDYIRTRCASLELLRLNAGGPSIKVLEEVWRRRDQINSGDTGELSWQWQDAMQALGIRGALF